MRMLLMAVTALRETRQLRNAETAQADGPD